MKINFRKISAIGASVLMAGMTMGFAAAANYPAPFVSGGASDVAIVYGASADTLDAVKAGAIQQNLQTYLGGGSDTTTTTSVTGGDSVLLERSSDKYNLGNSASSVFVTSVDSDDLPDLLVDGTYSDDDNTDYDYTQKISLGSNLNLVHFSDSDYMDKVPTIGVHLSDSVHVLNYTLDFTTHPAFNATTLETTTINLMGKEYYFLDVIGSGDTGYSDGKVTFLDTANSVVIAEGETKTVQGKELSIAFISSTEVKLNVDGQSTNTLAEGGTYKLSDGTYVGIKDILYSSKDGAVSSVEVSVGTGKLEIDNGDEIELNDETIEEIKGFLDQDASYKLDKIILQWTTDDEAFLANDSELVMPGFESVKFSISNFITKYNEVTKVEDNSDREELIVPLTSGTVTIPLLQVNSTGEFNGVIGKDTSNRLKTSTSTWVFVNETGGDKYIVASWNSTTEAESYYLKVDMVTEDNVNKVRFTNEADTTDVKKVTNASEASFGSVILTVNNVTRDGSKKWANISVNSGGSFHELYTKQGLKVFLPYYSLALSDANEGALNNTNQTAIAANAISSGRWFADGIYNGTLTSNAGHGFDSFYLFFDEEDKDSNLAGGTKFNATIDETSNSKVTVSTVDVGDSSGTYGYEIGESDNYQAYVNSDLATMTLYKTGGDQDTLEVTYHGDQAYSSLYLTAPDAEIVSTPGNTGVQGADLGEVLVKDTELSSVSGMNLIIVGGSCINSAAATLLGSSSPICGDAWMEATDVGAGQFMIKGYPDNTLTDKLALLVAGYHASDTANAAEYLKTHTVDTSKHYKGTSSTSAELVTETV